jgi:hypothetical protein
VRPPKRDNKDYEKVAIGEMLTGIIEECQYDEKHSFKGFQGKEDTVGIAIRFKLKLDNYQFPHYSRWMRLSLSEKANLYKKYVVKLVEGAVPDMDMDLDALKNMKIKVIWSEDGDFQNIDAIYPVGSKVKVTDPVPTVDLEKEEEPPIDPEGLPF